MRVTFPDLQASPRFAKFKARSKDRNLLFAFRVKTVTLDVKDGTWAMQYYLDLSDNLIESLSSIHVENSTDTLIFLNLTRNNISRIDSHTTITQDPWHARVVELILTKNNLQHIASLPHFTRLRRLDIDHNIISAIPMGWLTDLQSSHWGCAYQLNENNIQHVEDYAFHNLNISRLYLNRNKLQVVTTKMFSSAMEISSLDLSENLIRTVEGGAFATTCGI